MIGEVTNHLWQSTLFAAAAGLLAVAFRRNGAMVRYWLWFSASVKFFVPFALLMSLGSHLGWAPAAKAVARPAVSLAVEQIAEPFPDAFPAPVAPKRADWIPISLFSLWVCGLASVAAMRVRGWRRIRSAVRSSAAIAIPAAVEVRSAPGLIEPGVVGLLRPVLLLPAGIAQRLTPPQLEAVLAHELCHIRRRDNLLAAIHMTVEALFWFHPLVWWIGARLLEERERACDEEVLRLGSEPQVYAEGILNVCKFYAESPLVCVSGVTGSNIKRRIEDIMTNRIALNLNFAKKAALAVVGMAALAAPLVIGILHAPAIRAQSQAPVLVAPTVNPPSPNPNGPLMAPQALAQSLQGGRSMSPQPSPPATPDDEHNRRVAFAQAKFGNTVFGMGGTYVRYGPPDQIEDRSSDAQDPWQVWRYNYLEDFHSNVEFEFAQLPSGQQSMRINWPPPVATYEGAPVVDAVLAGAAQRSAAISRGNRSQGEGAATDTIAGLPGRHASFQIYPVKWYRKLSVPLDALSGQVQVVAQIQTRSNTDALGKTVANLTNLGQASEGQMQATFALDPGSYACHLIVREMASGRMYGETIDFEAQ